MKSISTLNAYSIAVDFSSFLQEKYNLAIETLNFKRKFLIDLSIKFCLILGLLFTFGGAVKAQTNGLNFDGINDKINLNTTIGNFGTGDFTVEVKIQMPATTVTRPLIAKRAVCSGGNFYNFVITANGFVALEISSGPPRL